MSIPKMAHFQRLSPLLFYTTGLTTAGFFSVFCTNMFCCFDITKLIWIVTGLEFSKRW